MRNFTIAIACFELRIGLLTFMRDCSRSDASIKSKEERANSCEYGEAKRIQRLTHSCDVNLSLVDKTLKED